MRENAREWGGVVLFQSIFCLQVGVVGLSSSLHRRVSWLSNITKTLKAITIQRCNTPTRHGPCSHTTTQSDNTCTP